MDAIFLISLVLLVTCVNLFVAIIAASFFYELFYPTHKRYDLGETFATAGPAVDNSQDHGRPADTAVFASYIPYSFPLPPPPGGGSRDNKISPISQSQPPTAPRVEDDPTYTYNSKTATNDDGRV